MSLLRYTGHPLVDVGVATITAFSGVESPENISDEHLNEFVNFIRSIYMNRTMAWFLHNSVFPNIYFAQPALLKDSKYDAVREEALKAYLNSYLPDAAIPGKEEASENEDRCIFSGDPAIIRVARSVIPLTGSRDDINFVAEGSPKYPISGWCLLAMLAMPLGALRSGNRLWLVHTPQQEWLQYFAAANLQRNRIAFHQQALEELPRYSFPRTCLIEDMLEAQKELPRHVSLTSYLFLNNNKRSTIAIHYLASSVISFVFEAKQRFGSVWDAIVTRAQEMPAQSKDEEGVFVYQKRNFFFEDLFDLPDRAFHFLRLYLLRQPHPGKATGRQRFDPRFNYSFIKERECIHWGLAELFLERIMNIDKERIASIKQLADRLADYIQRHDPRLFKRLFWARNDYTIRLELQKAANAAQRYSDAPLVPYDEFIRVFFFDEGDAVRPDWYLARDLLMIRIIERLHQSGWIEQHPDIAEAEEPETESEA